LTQQQYPGLSLAGVSLSKSILAKYELKGCGSCLEVRCTDKEVSMHSGELASEIGGVQVQDPPPDLAWHMCKDRKYLHFFEPACSCKMQP
jgi:hypothetical protein